MSVNINFGSPANESINTISQFSIYSKEPTPAIYTPQTLQYRNYLLERISQRVVNKNFEAQITGSTGSISGSDQEGGFGRQSLSTDLPSNVTHQVKIFTKNREMLIFDFYENNPVGKLTGKNFTDGY